MQKKSACRSGFLTPRTLVAFFLCAAACLIATGTLLAFYRSEARTKVSQRILTFAERVAYQRAIEDVYWRHRIWPRNGGERPDPKPPLDAVMSQAQLEKKVTDYLRKSQALEDYWQRPITAEQLQAEMDRMAKHTRQPEVLRELFETLGNDPFVIAECLGRPALADRLLTNWYAYDERIHGELKQRAEAELQAHNTVEQMTQLSGKYSEIEFLKADDAEERAYRDAGHGVKLTTREWEETVQKLAATFNNRPVAAGVSPSKHSPETEIKTGAVSPLQEDEERFYVLAVVNRNDSHLKLATVSWPKEPLASWLARAENQVPVAIPAQPARYTFPTILEGACVDNTWAATAAPPDPRDSHVAVWTGTEMIIWGGEDNNSLFINTGGKYNPITDAWTNTSTTNAPSARISHTAVWTGNEMIVWGGIDENFLRVNTGGKYNPETDTWTPTTTSNAPDGRNAHTAIWSGSEMIIWGGWDGGGTFFNTGGRYNPATNSWTTTTTANAPEARTNHAAVWTASEMIVWGGTGEFSNGLNTGGKYNPSTNSWTTTSTINAPDARYDHTAVWSGNEMIVWGGADEFSNPLDTGGRYNPSTNSWTATTTTNAPQPRTNHTAVWTGGDMIVWGGSDGFSDRFNTGGKYNPGTNNWTATSTNNAPDERTAHTTVWTGAEMMVWGGNGFFRDLNTGGRYNATTNGWVNIGHTPSARASHTAVWTGAEMVVWGGHQQDFLLPLNTGARYQPATDNWTATSVTNAPEERDYHTAVWTGSAMIVWGGYGCCGGLDTGGRYNPGTDTWMATDDTNAPESRYGHTAIWTGSEMIVWGGLVSSFLST
jgi:N-acetylneuraminic acid mutarotase